MFRRLYFEFCRNFLNLELDTTKHHSDYSLILVTMDSAARRESDAVTKGSEATSSANGNAANGGIHGGTQSAYKSASTGNDGGGGTPSAVKADRGGVTQAFAQFAQLIQASRRPLPNQTGDGTYSTVQKKLGLRHDLKYIHWKGSDCSIARHTGSLLTLQMSKPWSR